MSRVGRMPPRARGGRYNNAAYANMHNGPHNHAGPIRSMPQRRRKILGENTYRILIKESKVKVVLGPEGRHIKDIRNKCNEPCKITIYTQHANGEPFPPESPDRILNLECGPVDLENVLIELIPHLQVAAPELMMDKFNEIRLVVPEFVCSMIIGKQGINVKNIQKDFRSFVQVHKDPLPDSSEFVVSLTNKDVSCLAASVNRIYESIQSIKCISPVTMFNPVVWYPGDFGDTGSFIEDMNVRPQVQAPVYPEREEPRYYREQPRYEDDSRSHRSGYNRRNDHSFEDYDRSTDRHQHERSRGHNRARGQNVRGRNYHRGGRQNGNSRDRQNVQYRADPDSEHLSRNAVDRDDHYSEDTVIPRRPKSFRGRG
jgi:hypothetical protein